MYNKFFVFLLFSIFLISGCVQKPIPDLNTTPSYYQSAATNTPAITSSPKPFSELTIPYLRNRSYQSSLSELRPFSNAVNFKNYLTSYDSDGLKINALLTIPDGKRPESGWPAIVFIHGYIPPSQYKTTEKYVEYVNYLARNDFVVIKIDLRGHGQSEGQPSGAYYSSDYVIDTLNAYAALQSTEYVDRAKIGLWGHSMAGNVTLRALAAKPEIPAAVIWAGAGFSYSDLQRYRISDNSYKPQPNNSNIQQKRRELFEKYGEFNPESDFWKQVAATNYLSDIQSAIQLHHATDDSVVNIEYSRNLNTLLNQTSVQHELFEYTAGGHNLSGSSFNQAMQRTLDFYEKYLLNQ